MLKHILGSALYVVIILSVLGHVPTTNHERSIFIAFLLLMNLMLWLISKEENKLKK